MSKERCFSFLGVNFGATGAEDQHGSIWEHV